MKCVVSRRTARHGGFDIIHNETGPEISVVVADTVTVIFHRLHNSSSFWIVVFRTATQEYVVVHVFSETLVAVERVELPLGVELDSQKTGDDADR